MATKRLAIPLLLGAVLTAGACSSETALADRGSPATDAATPTDTGNATDDTAIGPPIVGYGLSGRLRVDQANGDAAQLDVIAFAADGSEVCAGPLSIALTVATPPEDEPVLAWWDVAINPAASDCSVPSDLFRSMGIGAWDERLAVALVQQGFEDATPFGLYVQATEDDPIWILGMAGTEPQLAGEELAEPPLLDGEYTIASLLQAPWPED